MVWNWLATFLLFCHCVASSPTAETKYGPIEGKVLTVFNGRNVDAYLGVPYAAPPIGQNRFAATRPPAPWKETLKTKTVSKSCIQPFDKGTKEAIWFLYEGPESEDCLYLNIWKPSKSGKDGLPVMVWIHGGANLGGSASMALYDGAILAAQNDVIVVTMNYRLAMFGYMYLNSSEVPGNAAVQDQIMAISWVNENIRNFGGDPKRVTLFGESSGGTCVSLHLVNPALSDLFQYAIMESGNLYQYTFTTTEADALNTSLEVAASVGCFEDDMVKLLECLRAKPAAELTKTFYGFPLYIRLRLEPVRNDIEVPRDLHNAIQKVPKSKRRNIISTNIPMEASAVTPFLFPDKNFNEDFAVDENEFRVLLENYFHLSDHRIQDIVIHEYRDFRAPYNDSQLRKGALESVSDNTFICPGIGFTKSWVTEQNVVSYLYFQHRPSRPIKAPFPNWVGATHGDEVPFVFGVPMDPKNGYTTEEAMLSKEIMKYWTNFAKYGDPNGPGEGCWPPVEPNSNFTYLVIKGNQVEPQTFLKERECDFWADIYHQLITIQEQLQ